MSPPKRTETGVVKVTPSWLATVAEADTSLELMKEYRVLQRVKLIQGQTSIDLKKAHGEGSAILSPSGILVATDEQSFDFVPLIFFRQFCLWKDIRDKASDGGPVIESSMDDMSDLAKLCRDPDKREKLYEPRQGDAENPWKYRYVEHLSFAGIIYKHDTLSLEPCVISFQRGEFTVGRNFISAIFMRKIAGGETVAPLWTQRWTMTPTRRERQFSWYGLDYRIPDEGGWIEEEDAVAIQKLHEELTKQLAAGGIKVDYTDADEDAETVANDGADGVEEM